MKCAIFCCLLAFCAFEIALTKPPTDLNKLYVQLVGKIGSFQADKEKEIKGLVDDGNKRGKDTSVCQINFKVPVINTVNNGEKLIWNCLNNASPNKTPTTPENCAQKQYNSTLSEVQFIVDTTKKCIYEKVYESN